MKKNCLSLSTSTTQVQSIKVYRYALADMPVPDGWSSIPMQGWHGEQGRVIWVKHDKRTE